EYTSLPFEKLMALQGAIFKEVTDEMRVPLRNTAEEGIDAYYSRQVSAHWYYMQGRFWSTERPNAEGQKLKGEDIAKKAIDSYEKAIEIDKEYAQAYAGLADMYASISGVSMDPTEAKNNAVRAVKNAQNFGENLAEVNASIGTEKWWLERDFSTARLAFQLAIRLNEQFSDSHKRYSSCLAALGKVREAEDEIQRALMMEPDSSLMQLTKGQNHFFAHQYPEAIEQLRTLVSKYPTMSAAHRFLALALEQKNQHDEALDQLEQSKGKSEPDSDFLGTRAHILARKGEVEEARKIALSLETAREKAKKEKLNYVSPYNIAVIYAEIPNKEAEAFKWLDLALLEFDPRVNWLKVDPRFSELRRAQESEFNQRLLAAGLPL
ncbi:MAG: tetratricopeptide repeat protein, partial [Pyrinomonadaceae bacterium]